MMGCTHAEQCTLGSLSLADSASIFIFSETLRVGSGVTSERAAARLGPSANRSSLEGAAGVGFLVSLGGAERGSSKRDWDSFFSGAAGDAVFLAGVFRSPNRSSFSSIFFRAGASTESSLEFAGSVVVEVSPAFVEIASSLVDGAAPRSPNMSSLGGAAAAGFLVEGVEALRTGVAFLVGVFLEAAEDLAGRSAKISSADAGGFLMQM